MKFRKGLEEKKLVEIGAWLLWGFKLCVLHLRHNLFLCLSKKIDSSNRAVSLPFKKNYNYFFLLLSHFFFFFFPERVFTGLLSEPACKDPSAILWSLLTSEVTMLNILTHELDDRGTGQQENSGSLTRTQGNFCTWKKISPDTSKAWEPTSWKVAEQ